MPFLMVKFVKALVMYIKYYEDENWIGQKGIEKLVETKLPRL